MTVKEVAQMVCASAPCYSCYKCDKKHWAGRNIPPIGKDTTCPLRKYDCEMTEPAKEDGNLWSPTFGNRDIEEYDLVQVCRECQYGGDYEETANEWYMDRDEEVMRNHCYDCPIFQEIECIQERAAEAACS